jgi:hypothetical protein
MPAAPAKTAFDLGRAASQVEIGPSRRTGQRMLLRQFFGRPLTDRLAGDQPYRAQRGARLTAPLPAGAIPESGGPR